LVEADPFGGVIAARFGLGDTPGLSTLAAQTRGGWDDAAVEAHIQRLPGGLPVLVGPPSPEEAQAVWRDVAWPLAEWAAGGSGFDVMVDRGRLLPGVPANRASSENDLVLVVARPTVDQLRSASLRQAALVAAGFEVSLLLIGDRPYGPDEVATTMRVPVLGVVAWDPRTAAALAGMAGAVRDLRRSPLVRSAATLAEQLATKPEPDRVEPSSVAVSEVAEEVGG
jgi:MinD-like ATPase involved in chromosome partitioning or flagellar assembly